MRLCRPCLAVLIVGLLAGAAEGQQGTSAVRGRILDEQAAALPGVTVVVTHQQTGIFRDTVTGPDGVYSVQNLVPGPYRIAAELGGFKRVTTDVVLIAGLTQTQDLTLQIGTISETLTVTGQAPPVDVTSAVVGANISLKEVQAMPSLSHGVMSFAQVVPGVVYLPTYKPSTDGLTINGQSAGVHYYVDGGENYSAVFSGSVGNRVMTPSGIIQEIVAVTTQLPAEYGGRTGGVVNAITKQGTNAFQGSFDGFFNNTSLTGRDYFVKLNNLAVPDVKRDQGSFTLGGPLVHNRLFFFGALEYSDLERSNTVVYTANPDKSFSSVATLKAWNSFIRVDHQINANNTYGIRVLGRKAKCSQDPNCRAGFAGNVIAQGGATRDSLNDEWELGYLIVANYNKVFSATKLNVLTFSRPWQSIQTGVPSSSPNADTECVPCLPPTLRYLSFDDQVSFYDHHRYEPQNRLEDSFSWFIPGDGKHGSHDLKFGGVYNYATHIQHSDDAENGIFGFSTNNPFNPAVPSTYPETLTIRVSPQTSDPVIHSMGLYAQDKWQVTGNLTVSLGVRYDVVWAKSPNEFNPLFADRASYPVDWRDIGPRLGFAYGGADKKSVIRGGYGQLFQSPIFSSSTDFFWRQGVYGTGLVVVFPTNGVADPGPSAGRLPANPFLVNGPVVNRTLLNQLYSPDTLIRNPSAVYLDNPDRRLPTSRQLTLGYQRELFANLSFAADYIHTWGSGDVVPFDLNPGLRATTSRTAPITRTDLQGLAGTLGLSPFSTSVLTFKNDGSDRYDGLNLSFEKRFSQRWGARVSYTRGRCTNNVDAGNNFQVLANENLTWGPCTGDRAHILNLSGQLEVPRTGGLNVSSTFRYLSGQPITIQNTAFDVNQNGILVDPVAPGSYSGTGVDAFTVDNQGGFNGARGPKFNELDLRLGYRFRLGGHRTIAVSADVYNVASSPNFANPSGDQRQPTFLRPTALLSGAIPRQAQFGARLDF